MTYMLMMVIAVSVNISSKPVQNGLHFTEDAFTIEQIVDLPVIWDAMTLIVTSL